MMKKLRVMAAVLALTLGLCCGSAGAEEEKTLTLPESSGELSYELALQALELCTGHTQDNTAALFKKYGFSIVMQRNFDKADDDPSHTCAYTVGRRDIEYAGGTRPLVAVAIRGTNAGEWFSNFDVTPSRNAVTLFAENFMLAAQDVFQGLKEALAAETDPLVLICGHSRGAACANLLSTLVNSACGAPQVFVYTFATPATVCGDFAADNVFNFINPCDMVPCLPLSSWGFKRIGQDIVLPGDEAAAQAVQTAVDGLSSVAGSLQEYYETRHSLTGPGESEDGMTVFEMMQLLSASLMAQMTGQPVSDGNAMGMLSPDSDFAPLMAFFAAMGGQDGQVGMEALNQHMGTTYDRLIRSIM